MQKGIVTFMDHERIRREKSIIPELLEAIEKSRFAIVILSKKYASSKLCLDELAKIVECKEEMSLTVLPVFYHVDPSDVRNQRGTFEQAFAKHQAANVKEMEPWKAALAKVANLPGCIVDR